MNQLSPSVINEGRFGRKSDLISAFSSPFGAHSDAIKTLPEQLAEILAEKIINGSFALGERLYEVSLADQFSVSRGPVREALRLLEREGLVTITSRRGASVAKLTKKRLENIFSVRAALMGICAEDVARRADHTIHEALDEGTFLLFAAHESGDLEEFLIIVYQLSMYIGEVSDNEIAKDILLSLGRQTLPITRQIFELLPHRITWATDWKRIADAIQASDPEAARNAVHVLLGNVRNATMEIYVKQQEMSRKK